MSPELAKSLEEVTSSDYYQYLVDGKVDTALKRIAQRYWWYLAGILAVTVFFLGYKFWDFQHLQTEINRTKAELEQTKLDVETTKRELEGILEKQKKDQDLIDVEQQGLSASVSAGKEGLKNLGENLDRLGGDARSQKLVLASMTQIVDNQTKNALKSLEEVRLELAGAQREISKMEDDVKDLEARGAQAIQAVDTKLKEIGPTPPELVNNIAEFKDKAKALEDALGKVDGRIDRTDDDLADIREDLEKHKKKKKH